VPFSLIEFSLRFRSEIEIEKPIDEVVQLFDNPDNTLKWLEGLRSVKHISGERRQSGAKSKVVMDSAAGRMLITETIINNNLPEEYIIRYDGMGYVSYSNYQFEKLSDANTLFIIQQDVELKGALKLAGGLVRGTVKRQLNRSTECFKVFAEKH